MIPALIILALWVALLAPGVLRWLREHQPTTSIASFHRQLRLLEHSGPKIVEPAYRLGGVGGQVTEREPPPAPVRVPRLVLLSSGPTDKESTMRYDDRYGEHAGDGYDRAEEWDADPWPRDERGHDAATRSYRTVRAPRYDDYDAVDDYDDYDATPIMTPERAKARRTRIIAGIGAAIVGSFVLGLVPGLTVLWAVTLISVVTLVCYLGLMYYAASAGLYGHDAYAPATPVARVVMPTFGDRAARRDDDGWEYDQIAAAR